MSTINNHPNIGLIDGRFVNMKNHYKALQNQDCYAGIIFDDVQNAH